MNEQWNEALDQVEDEFLSEAASYRRKRYWPRVAAATAAVLVLAVGWSVLRQPQPPTADPTEGTAAPDAPVAAEPNCAPGSAGGFWDNLFGGSSAGQEGELTYGMEEEPNVVKTLHFSNYAELQQACLRREDWFLHRDVMIPCLEGQPMGIEDITVFETEMYYEPWAWYFISHQPHITVRVPTMPSLTASMDPETSGSEALRQIWPDAPNLHNREAFTNSYSEIREVQIATSEGVKTALLRQEVDRDRVYLTFLQNGTLVTVAGSENALEGDWLETFSLIPIDSL